MYIGVTLLYSFEEKERLIGKLISYVVSCEDFQSLLLVSHNKAVEEIRNNLPGYKFLGVEDVFSVSGKIAVHEVLGRSALYELNDFSKSKELVQDPNKYSFYKSKIKMGSYFVASLVYFYKGVDKGNSFAFTILTLLEKEPIANVIKRIAKVSVSDEFLYKISKVSFEELNPEKIMFVGIEDISLIEDFESTGCFQTLYNDTINTESELKKILPSIDELKGMVFDVIIRPLSKE